MSDDRINPDDLLKAIQPQGAHLRLFLGMSAGVGKTYAMLKAAHQKRAEGRDVVIGLVETHGRVETEALLKDLEVIPRRKIDYKGTALEEMDVDAIIKRKPEIVIVDELAHTNAPTSRHKKRYQDVFELLDHGIEVFSALNVQHLESRKEAVEAITQITIRETVPDGVLDRANQVELVDIAPNELLKRLKEGKVYLGDRADRAAANFFKEDRLTALREIALRTTAEHVDQDLQRFASTTRDRAPWSTNDRLMTAISHSPSSEKLIRTARRFASNLEAPWIAVHIDTGRQLSAEDQLQLSKNIALAKELNAEVITSTDTDVVEALKRIARQKNVTQVLVGRPTRRWFRDRLEGGSLLDRLVRESLEIDVHVVSQEGRVYQPPALSEMRPKIEFLSRPIHYWNTFWFLTGTTVLGAAINPVVEYRSIGFLYLLAVLLVGAVSSLGAVIFAAVLSVIAWNLFFIPPILTLHITEPADWALCATFFFVALIMGYLSHRLRSHETLIREREERTNVLYEVLKDMTSSESKDEFLPKVCHRIGRLLNADAKVVLASEGGPLLFSGNFDEKAKATAIWSFESGKQAGWSTDTLSEADALYIPMVGRSSTVGVFIFKPKQIVRLNSEQETMLLSVTRQLGLTLERYFIEKRLQASRRLEESERLHQTLLNSISHEMRTPLTAILGSASALENEEAIHNPAFVREAAAQLSQAGERLNRVIGNLLDMSRLESGVLALKTEWEEAGDLVRTVVQKNAKLLSHHRVTVDIEVDLPLIKVDARLMEHAISNLIVNAAAYAPKQTAIRVKVVTVSRSLEITVEDEGPGIPLKERKKIFEKFYRLPGSAAGGTGLGLSIVRSIVEAHAGHIDVGEPASHNGTSFTIALPLPDEAPEAPEALL